MSIIRWNPSLGTLSRWPNFWDDDEFPSLGGVSNNIDVYETKDEVIIKANVAGVPLEKIDVTYEKGVLWIQAAVEEKSDDTEKKHYSRSSWSYSYKVAVPGEVDTQKEPSAEVADGVIKVVFKKAAASQPKKLIVSQKK